MNYLKKAKKYIANNTIPNSEKCLFHLCPETGWLNDPNGYSFFCGKTHMFYQFHPYKAKWNSMHWGHAVTDDGIKWQYLPVALAPTLPTAIGKACYSGSAVEMDGRHYLMFTENFVGQRQCIAVSDNGIDYTRIMKPVIGYFDLPKFVDFGSFRDPKLIEKNGKYYVLVGAMTKTDQKKKSCNVLMFSSDNLVDWAFVGKLFDDEYAQKHFGDMAECPDFFSIDGKDVLIVSPWRKQKVVYSVGKLDYETGKFEGTDFQKLDFGGDFFATQTLSHNGTVSLCAWAQPNNPESVMQRFGWNGVLTLPRTATLVGDQLLQLPPESLSKYRTTRTDFDQKIKENTLLGASGECLDIELEIEDVKNGDGIMLFSDNKNGLKIYFENGDLVIDRTDNYEPTKIDASEYVTKTQLSTDKTSLTLRIVVDRFILEVFANGGERAFSTLISPSTTRQGVSLLGCSDSRFVGTVFNLQMD